MTDRTRATRLTAAGVTCWVLLGPASSGGPAGAEAAGSTTGRSTVTVSVGELETIATEGAGSGLLTAELLSDGRGHVAFVWKTSYRPIRAVRRTAAGGWLRPVNLGEGSWPDAAMASGGRLVVTWWRNDRREVVTRRSTAHGWEPTAVLYATPRGSNRRASNPSVAVNPAGDAFVSWWSGTAYDFFDRGAPSTAPAPARRSSKTRRGMRAAVRPHDGDWSAAEWMVLHGGLHGMFVDAAGRPVVLRRSGDALSVWTRVGKGAWKGGPGVDLEGSPIAGAVRNPRGDVVVTASPVAPNTDDDTSLVQVIRKEADGGWFPAVTVALAEARWDPDHVVIDGAGRASILFVTDKLPALVSSNVQGEWSSPLRFTAHGHRVTALRLACGPKGALAAVWREAKGQLWAVYRAGAHAAWSDPVQVSRAADPGEGVIRPDVTSAGGGAFLVSWISSDGNTDFFLGRSIGPTD
ncbi:MAG: hypothetical protein U0R80_00185 [Nocardioidaceae bacterium]